jgi:hypothetical protein
MQPTPDKVSRRDFDQTWFFDAFIKDKPAPVGELATLG